MRRPLIVLGLLLIPCWAVHAQPGSRANLIRLNAGAIDTSAQQTQARAKSAASAVGKQLRLIQFSGPIQPEWLADLEKSGMRIVDYIPENAYLVYGSPTAVRAMQSKAVPQSHVRWEGSYRSVDKVHPEVTQSVRTKSSQSSALFSIQLVLDPEINPTTLRLIDSLKKAPFIHRSPSGKYYNIAVSLPVGVVSQISERPDVISIQPYSEPQLQDERQCVIVAGQLTNEVVYQNTNGLFLPVATNIALIAPGYLQWLAQKGFTQEQFDASGLVVDVSDSAIEDGTNGVNHFALYRGGTIESNSPCRVVYSRLEGTTNAGNTLAGIRGHGSHVAHIVAGLVTLEGETHVDAAGYRYGMGVAPFVKVGNSIRFDYNVDNGAERDTFPIFDDMAARAYRDGARISNNSWAGDGGYDWRAQNYDYLVRDAQRSGSAVPVAGNQQMTFVFAAGNAGPGASTVKTPGTAKNVITVGACENLRPEPQYEQYSDNPNDITSFSSRGPSTWRSGDTVEEGHMKPDIVAPGKEIVSGVPQAEKTMSGTGTSMANFKNGYYFFPKGQRFYWRAEGTSMAAPAVSGAAALVFQWFINRGWATAANPVSPAMTKAYLLSSARYLTGNGSGDSLPSPAQGMGMVDLERAFDDTPRVLADQRDEDTFTASGQSWTWSGKIATGAKPLRITVAWTDAPGSTTGAPYNNDLDLTAVVNGVTYRGNNFNGAHSIAGGDNDARNNVESVFLPSGITGEIIVTVSAANINSDGVPGRFQAGPSAPGEISLRAEDQDFALVAYNMQLSKGPYPTQHNFDMVRVGDEGNAPDAGGFGSVGYAYDLGKYEVTLAQYAEFLNAVARTSTPACLADLWNVALSTDGNVAGISRSGSGTSGDPFTYAAIGGGSRPVTYVSWFDAARFANWLHNGATEDSDTETGAYTLNGATNGPTPPRNLDATWWIPTENEWYKAAYYKSDGTNADYWSYPTQTDSLPGNSIGNAINQANYYAGKYAVTQSPVYSSSTNYLTDIGAFSMSPGAYGTHDQAGNVWEWIDIAAGGGNAPGQEGLRGGDWESQSGGHTTERIYDAPDREDNRTGFRVASVVNTDADLSELWLQSGQLPMFQPTFRSGSSTYTALLPLTATQLLVKPTLAQVGASLEARINGGIFSSVDPALGFQANALTPGINTIELRVVSPDGFRAKSYRLLVARGSSDSNLAAMTLSVGTLSPAFQSATTIYSANVANEIASLTVTPTAAHSGATLQLRLNNGAYATVSNSSPSNALPLNVGMNDVQLKVTSEDGSSTKIYNITITRAFSSNANLSAINLSSGTLSPAFSTATSYAASVDFWSKSITLTPNVEQADATVQVRVNGGAYSSVASASASSTLALGVGKNTIEVKVTAQDGTTTKTYTLEVTRDPMIIQTVAVGDAGNAPNVTGYGAVSYPYRIGKYEITLGEYAEFLNAVARNGDPYGLYPIGWGGPELMRADVAGISRDFTNGVYTFTPVTPVGVNPAGADSPANRPVSFMTLFNAARFANWLANGQPSGGQDATTTEDGAYALNGATSGTIARNATNPNTGAPPTWWIPTENEWYKAAYYKGGGTNAGYWLYPTQSDTKPGNTIGAASNQANHKLLNGAGDAWVYSVPNVVNALYSQNALTDVGAFSNSASAYGTFDQGGNVWEWNHTQVGDSYLIRGGDYGSANADSRDFLKSSADQVSIPANWKGYSGFRMATLPNAVASPRILSISRGANGFSLSWTNASTVHVQRRTSLSTGAWETISSNNTSGSYLDLATPANRAFYRLILP